VTGVQPVQVDTREYLVFKFEGDDHETEVIDATNEADARESCAATFNDRYRCECGNAADSEVHDEDCAAAEYTGDEFDLIGVYRGDSGDYCDEWVAVSTWPGE